MGFLGCLFVRPQRKSWPIPQTNPAPLKPFAPSETSLQKPPSEHLGSQTSFQQTTESTSAATSPKRAPSTRQTAIHQKRGRSKHRHHHLAAFSDRIRKILSREPKPLNAVSEEYGHRRDHIPVSYPTVSLHSLSFDHALGSGLVSERGYDSDAQSISLLKGADYTGHSNQSAPTGSESKCEQADMKGYD
jgi:hypothetical protein